MKINRVLFFILLFFSLPNVLASERYSSRSGLNNGWSSTRDGKTTYFDKTGKLQGSASRGGIFGKDGRIVGSYSSKGDTKVIKQKFFK